MKGKILNRTKKLSEDVINILLIIGMFMTSIGLPTVVHASGNTTLVIDSMSNTNTITNIDSNDTIEFKIGENEVGSVRVRISGTETYITPTEVDGKYVFDTGETGATTIDVILTATEGYTKTLNYNFNNEVSPLSSDNIILDLVAGGNNDLLLSFESNDDQTSFNDNPTITLATPGGLTSSIDTTNTNQINYKRGETLIGSAILKVGDNIMTPTIDDSGDAIFVLTKFVDTRYTATIIVTPTTGNSLDMYYHIDGAQETVSLNTMMVNIEENKGYRLQFEFMNGAPQQNYSVVGYFSGVTDGVDYGEDYMVIPSNWKKGNITLKIKIRTLSDGSIIPAGISTEGNTSEMTIHPLIANRDEVNNTIEGGSNETIVVKDGFDDYGRITVHLINDNIGLNQFINIVTEDAIVINADANMTMSGSLGTANINQSLVTTSSTGSVSVFFGNSMIRLSAHGVNVDSITSVTGNVTTQINSFGDVEVTLPSLSEATTIPVEVTIKLKDNTTVTKTINIVRTAIQLHHTYGDDDDSVYAGYVVNKGYLYNNQDHNDDIFDAYLQVILYKDDAVVGYKQIQIDDEYLIDHQLGDDQSGTLEIYSENQIPLYGKVTDDLTDGINKISVFLTNGPIDFDGDTLPSVEFGIGSGVTLEWGAAE